MFRCRLAKEKLSQHCTIYRNSLGLLTCGTLVQAAQIEMELQSWVSSCDRPETES